MNPSRALATLFQPSISTNSSSFMGTDTVEESTLVVVKMGLNMNKAPSRAPSHTVDSIQAWLTSEGVKRRQSRCAWSRCGMLLISPVLYATN